MLSLWQRKMERERGETDDHLNRTAVAPTDYWPQFVLNQDSTCWQTNFLPVLLATHCRDRHLNLSQTLLTDNFQNIHLQTQQLWVWTKNRRACVDVAASLKVRWSKDSLINRQQGWTDLNLSFQIWIQILWLKVRLSVTQIQNFYTSQSEVDSRYDQYRLHRPNYWYSMAG